jgi:hypothetical protein
MLAETPKSPRIELCRWSALRRSGVEWRSRQLLCAGRKQGMALEPGDRRQKMAQCCTITHTE